jgi:hypothetical protein
MHDVSTREESWARQANSSMMAAQDSTMRAMQQGRKKNQLH